MSNLNSVSEVQKTVISINAIFISFAQKVQKHEIHFEIKYFDEEFNLSKSNQSYDYDSNSTDDDSDEESDNKEFNKKSTHLALLTALQKPDLLIYFEAIQNVDDEILSSSDKVFAIKKQLADLHMKDLVELASYREVMNS